MTFGWFFIKPDPYSDPEVLNETDPDPQLGRIQSEHKWLEKEFYNCGFHVFIVGGFGKENGSGFLTHWLNTEHKEGKCKGVAPMKFSSCKIANVFGPNNIANNSGRIRGLFPSLRRVNASGSVCQTNHLPNQKGFTYSLSDTSIFFYPRYDFFPFLMWLDVGGYSRPFFLHCSIRKMGYFYLVKSSIIINHKGVWGRHITLKMVIRLDGNSEHFAHV